MNDAGRVILHAERAVLNLHGNISRIHADAGVPGFGIFDSHLPEGIFDDAGGIIAHSDFQKQDLLPFMIL